MKKILLMSDAPPGGNGGTAITIENLQKEISRLNGELAEANKKIEAFTAAQAQATADEVVIREKMAHGLTRDQAIAVIRRQRAHDEAEAAAAKAKAEKSPKK